MLKTSTVNIVIQELGDHFWAASVEGKSHLGRGIGIGPSMAAINLLSDNTQAIDQEISRCATDQISETTRQDALRRY